MSASVYIKGKRITNSGSGFIANGGSSALVTSANWMRSVLNLRLDEDAIGTRSSFHLEWKELPGTKFSVQYRPRGSDQLEISTATIAFVRLMPDVFRTVCNLWLETPPAVHPAPKSRGGHVDESLQSLLYPSSVVVLKCAPTVLDR